MSIYSKINMFVYKEDELEYPIFPKYPSDGGNKWSLIAEIPKENMEDSDYLNHYSNENAQDIADTKDTPVALERVYDRNVVSTSDYAFVQIFLPGSTKSLII